MSTLDPLELLSNKGNRENTFLNDKYNPVAGGVFGFGLAMVLNWGFRKPIFSGIQNHAALCALGVIAGKYIDNLRNEHYAKRDAILRHYVELHPDDFPPIERKKYGEIIEPWVPIR